MTTAPRPVRAPRAAAVLLFALVWLSCVWFGSWALNPNNATRMFAALSLAERGEASIDRFQTLTIDKAAFTRRRSGTHYYMDKAPGVTLMALPVVWATGVVTGGHSGDQVIDITSARFEAFLALRMRLSIALGAAVLTAAAAVLLFDLGTGITGSRGAGLFAALGYSLGSVAWGWSTTLFGHAPVAALLLIATWAVWRGTSGAVELARWRYPLIAGGALGWAAVIEFPAALGGIAIGIWALWRSRAAAWRVRRRLYLVALATAIVALLPLVGYNQLAFGTPFRLGYQGVVGFGGMQEGLFGLTYPKPDALFGILFGLRRGLIWVAPVLILGVVGLARMGRVAATRDLALVSAAVITIVLLVNASYAYWDGGASTGPRHSVPAIPFLAIGLAPFWSALRTRVAQAAAGLALGSSMALNLVIVSTDMFAPEQVDNPIWTRNIWGLFMQGRVSGLPSDYAGWSRWWGFVLYLDLALPLLALLIWVTWRAQRTASIQPTAIGHG